MDWWRRFLGFAVFSADAVAPEDRADVKAVPFDDGVLAGIGFEGTRLCFDFAEECEAHRAVPSLNAEIVERAVERCGAVFVRQLLDTPSLKGSVSKDTTIEGYVLGGRLYVDFYGLVLPVAVARSLADALFESFKRDALRVRPTAESEWREVVLASSSYEFY